MTLKISLDSNKLGYFTPDSTIDFCEANNIHSYYIAELFNTLSSFIYVVYAIIIIKQTRLVGSGLLLGVIGIGSALFHATLIYKLQLLDELPMLWFASWNLQMIMQNEWKQYKWIPIVLAITTSITHVYFEIPELFFIVHMILQIPLVYFAISLSNISNYRPYIIK